MAKPKATQYKKSIVIGLLLGDGYLYPGGRLQVEQSIKNEEYLNWLYIQLQDLASGPISSVTRIHPKTKKCSYSRRFYTKSLFQDLESIFYMSTTGTGRIKRKKIVPKNLKQFLDPIVLAIWFMDDGGKSQSTPEGAYINATSFSQQERVEIQEAFLRVLNLKINIQKAGGNNQYNSYIPANSYDTFFQIVYPLMKFVPSMLYKLSTILQSLNI